MTRAVALGGGHGLARTLRALSQWADDVTAVVTVADDGGSSGRLRRDLGVVPPGDLRMALLALAHDERLADVAAHRFRNGELSGHSLGNLMLVGMIEQHDGDVIAALATFAELLGVRGTVLPCTTTPVTMHADTLHGVVHGQAAIAATADIARVWLDDGRHSDVTSHPNASRGSQVCAPDNAVEAIVQADVIVIGPGSLYTSVLPNLLVDDIAQAVAAATGLKVFVANLREQRGETQGMQLSDHLRALHTHVASLAVDVVVVHGPSSSPQEGPAVPGLQPLRCDERVAEYLGVVASTIVEAPLVGDDDGHDPHRLAQVLRQLHAERHQFTAAG